MSKKQSGLSSNFEESYSEITAFKLLVIDHSAFHFFFNSEAVCVYQKNVYKLYTKINVVLKLLVTLDGYKHINRGHVLICNYTLFDSTLAL